MYRLTKDKARPLPANLTNAFAESNLKFTQTNHTSLQNENLEGVSQDIFDVQAKKADPIWKRETYKSTEFRAELNQTTDRLSLKYDAEIAEKLHINKFNKKVTPISEFSNAVHNGRVFKTPKFTSC